MYKMLVQASGSAVLLNAKTKALLIKHKCTIRIGINTHKILQNGHPLSTLFAFNMGDTLILSGKIIEVSEYQ